MGLKKIQLICSKTQRIKTWVPPSAILRLLGNGSPFDLGLLSGLSGEGSTPRPVVSP